MSQDDDPEDVPGPPGREDGDNSSSAAARELRQIVERIENLEEEKTALADDIKAVYAEAKGRGYDTKVLRKVIAIRKRSEYARDKEEAILEAYLTALEMR